MTTDPFIIALSFIAGFPLGVFLGIVATHYLADKFAGQVFDGLLQLRAAARLQMEQHQATTRGVNHEPVQQAPQQPKRRRAA